MNVTAQQIGKYERGEDQIKVGTLIGLATVLGVDIAQLIPTTATGFAETSAPPYLANAPARGLLAECRDDILAALDRAETRLAEGGR